MLTRFSHARRSSFLFPFILHFPAHFSIEIFIFSAAAISSAFFINSSESAFPSRISVFSSGNSLWITCLIACRYCSICSTFLRIASLHSLCSVFKSSSFKSSAFPFIIVTGVFISCARAESSSSRFISISHCSSKDIFRDSLKCSREPKTSSISFISECSLSKSRLLFPIFSVA